MRLTILGVRLEAKSRLRREWGLESLFSGCFWIRCIMLANNPPNSWAWVYPTKGKFRDALCLRFGWQPVNLPLTCVCGKSFSVEHAFSCPCSGLPSIHHNEVRDLTASLLSEVWRDVGVEPALQLLDHEPLWFATTNREDGACLDVVARDIWGHVTFKCLTLLRTPILAFHCQDAIMFMSRRSVELMMNRFGRWRELAFHP